VLQSMRTQRSSSVHVYVPFETLRFRGKERKKGGGKEERRKKAIRSLTHISRTAGAW